MKLDTEDEMAEPVDYAIVLADLRARRARLDQLIAGIEATMLGGGGDVPLDLDAAATSGPILPTTIHPDTFFGISIIEAAKKFLKIARRAQHTTAIAEALAQGGQKRPTDAVLSSILVRAAKGRELTKVGRGTWGLSEWYPKAPKEPVESRPKRHARKAPAAKRSEKRADRKADSTRRTAVPASNGDAPHGALSGMLREILRGGKPLHVREITREINTKGNPSTRATIEGVLNRWAKKGQAVKPAVGTFALPT